MTLSTNTGTGKAVKLVGHWAEQWTFQIDKKDDYLSGTGSTSAVFDNSTLSQPTTTTVKVVLGTWDGNGSRSVGSFNSNNVGNFVPASTLKDAAGITLDTDRTITMWMPWTTWSRCRAR